MNDDWTGPCVVLVAREMLVYLDGTKKVVNAKIKKKTHIIRQKHVSLS